MGNVAIRVENLGKMYRIGGKHERYSTLRDTLVDAIITPLRKTRGLLRGESAAGLKEEIWALKKVSFEINHGEVIGIIGRNGAGKSTLLKVLSRITGPSTGYADVYGRIGALLEVGTGFHPELTGRENIYLNGAILGMSRRDINRKFDEIVDFSGVEKFIDTPVKHYSSGMGLRLGFAVAAHLDPEILVVDEVLAVGDAEFQNKCLGKMGDVAKGGRTVLLVSHNMAAIANLCEKVILLHNGELVGFGPTQEIITRYVRLRADIQSGAVDLPNSKHIERVELLDNNGKLSERLPMGQPLTVRIRLKQTESLPFPVLSVFVCNHLGDRLFILGTYYQTDVPVPKAKSGITLEVTTDPLFLLPGTYTLDIGCGSLGGHPTEYLHNLIGFTIEPADVFGTGRLPSSNQGIIAQKASWNIVNEKH